MNYPAGNFEILAFYCRQFGGGTGVNGAALYAALEATVGGSIPFKVLEDADNMVVGNAACDVYQWLSKYGVMTNGNFNKVLLNQCGQIMGVYDGNHRPMTMSNDVQQLLF